MSSSPEQSGTPEEILKPEEAAKLLRVSPEALRRFSRRGTQPGAFKVGSQWRYRRADLVPLGGQQRDKQQREE